VWKCLGGETDLSLARLQLLKTSAHSSWNSRFARRWIVFRDCCLAMGDVGLRDPMCGGVFGLIGRNVLENVNGESALESEGTRTGVPSLWCE